MISAPGSPNMTIAAYMVGLPPGRIITFSGDTWTPVVASVRRTTASRVASRPVAGV